MIAKREAPDPVLLQRMVEVLHHRGPDEKGIYLDHTHGVGLAHARLSIVDLAGGHQPMRNADGTIWITFNGEIFNHVELREKLVRAGHRFSTRSDTEVILHMYEEDGIDCVRALNGQWAFAIWDTNRSTLFLSRDRVGILPLYYTACPDAFLFASEVKALFQCQSVERQMDVVGLAQLFTFWATVPPRTVFKDIWELPPGHSMLVKDGCFATHRYWHATYHIEYDERNSQQEVRARDELLDLLRDGVRIRMRADVPVGVYLSGGLDSSLVTALAAVSGVQKLDTFSVGFDNAEYDESVHRQHVIDAFNLPHRNLLCTADSIANDFTRVIRHIEKPILRTAPVPMYGLSAAVRDCGYKVVLTGEGADEVLGGYDIFKEAKIRRFCAASPQSRSRRLLLRRLYPYLPTLQNQLHRLPPELNTFFLSYGESHPFSSHMPRWQVTSALKRLFSGAVRSQLANHDPYADLMKTIPEEYHSWDWFSRAQYLETALFLPGYLLSSQGDRVSMAHSVETRFPFLDPRVVDFCSTLPATWKMKVLNEKWLLKQAAAGLVPDAVRLRTKQPYRAPAFEAFCSGNIGSYVTHILSNEVIRDYGIFEPTAVNYLFDKFKRKCTVSAKDEMAFVGVLSTQTLIDLFVHESQDSYAHKFRANPSIYRQDTSLRSGNVVRG